MRKISKNLNKIGNNKEQQQNASILYNLSLFKTYEYLEELFINKNEKKQNIFNQAFIALKNWAKANCIYNSQFGFLDRTSISLMLTKVFLLYPEANIIELIERFFIIFSTWDWHVPLRIKSNQNNEKNQEDTKEKFMTVYIPVYPEHSLTSKITKTNQQIILNALLNGLENVVKFFSNQPNEIELVYMKNNAEGSEFIKTVNFKYRIYSNRFTVVLFFNPPILCGYIRDCGSNRDCGFIFQSFFLKNRKKY
uniref:polynucleotide adenylyltransferase n=1 Tax=Meloidogyne enterolobii TaxID=390850 RepID=A0A6V7UQX8_MELEN|nr:unnamed protein product [Meloidogyne enterolobii]